MWSFSVQGPPVPRARPRFSRASYHANPAAQRSAAYQEKLAAHGRVAVPRGWPTEGVRYAVVIDVVTETDRVADVDNFAKSVLDGLQGIAWRNDSDVRLCVVGRRKDKTDPHLEVWVCKMEDSWISLMILLTRRYVTLLTHSLSKNQR